MLLGATHLLLLLLLLALQQLRVVECNAPAVLLLCWLEAAVQRRQLAAARQRHHWGHRACQAGELVVWPVPHRCCVHELQQQSWAAATTARAGTARLVFLALVVSAAVPHLCVEDAAAVVVQHHLLVAAAACLAVVVGDLELLLLLGAAAAAQSVPSVEELIVRLHQQNWGRCQTLRAACGG
jgi:hypothetical protein